MHPREENIPAVGEGHFIADLKDHQNFHPLLSAIKAEWASSHALKNHIQSS